MALAVGTGHSSEHRRAVLRWLGLGVAASAWPLTSARAVESRWPSRTVRLLVAYPTGGVSDHVARDLARQLSTRLPAGVVVDNRPGAGGSIAMKMLMRSQPDGHTLGFAAVTAVRLAAQDMDGSRSTEASDCDDRRSAERQGQARGPARDRSSDGGRSHAELPVTPVAGVMRTPVLIAGTPALAAASFADMLRWARARPGALRWATTGEGTTGHAVMEQVSRAGGIGVVHVPYKGGGQQIADALGGHFEVLSTNVAGPQLQAIAAGHLAAMAVGSPQRVSVLPDTPTLAELGFPQANLDSLFGVFAPPSTPPAIVRRIHQEVARALRDTPLAGNLTAMSNVPFNGSTTDFEAEVLRRFSLDAAPAFRC
jgi:tripartite-type tricarboxylate transporter receptor subunit TctC